MKNKGFSLVELIVVIAIMAILVGVAVPVYTSYIGKAQKNKDVQMVDEVKRAVEIGLIAKNPATFAGGVAITFDTDGCELVGGSTEDQALVNDIMNETFGTTWQDDLTLSYEDWEEGTAQTAVSAYVGSTFDGKEDALLTQVQNLASVLSTAVKDGNASLIGQNYANYLSENGITGSNAIGNAAVLYVADDIAKLDDQKQALLASSIVSTLSGDTSPEGLAGYANVQSTASIAASTYAGYEAMYQYIHANGCVDNCTATTEVDTCPLAAWHATDYSAIKTTQEALDAIDEAGLGAMDVVYDSTEDIMATYAEYVGFDAETGDCDIQNSIAYKDANAFVAAMNAVDESESVLIADKESLNSNTCYTDGTMYNRLISYIEIGGAKLAVLVNGDANGDVNVTIYPENLF